MCNVDPFEGFCKDLEIQIERSKVESNYKIIRDGSIFRTNGMLYFLICITTIYLLSFFFENKISRTTIGIPCGLFILLSWTKYFIERNRKVE
jgi:hypothetical protein